MDSQVRYGELTFDASFLFARHGSEAELKFTRSERALLLAFTRSPRTVLTRNQLLDAIAGTGSDASDRSIDFLINRLRAKLRDSARAPALIATQYGEGYVWIAEPVRAAPVVEAFLVIGPVSGLERLAVQGPARQFLDTLKVSLDLRVAAGQAVVLAMDWRPSLKAAPPGARFSLDVRFYGAGAAPQVAGVLREGASLKILAAHRLSLDTPEAAPREAEVLAGRVQAVLSRF